MTSISVTTNLAADYIEKHGWCKHISQDSDGRVCAIGAMSIVLYGYHCDARTLGHPARFALIKFTGADNVSDWNNAPERTAEEVIQVLRDVAIKHQSDEM